MDYSGKKIALNYAMNTLLTIGSIVFPLITFPYASRMLGPSGTGSVAFVSSITTYFTLFAQLGMPLYGVRECAKVRGSRQELSQLVTELLVLSLITTVISIVLLVAAVALLPQLNAYRDLFIVFGATVVLGSLGMEWLFKGLEEYAYISVCSLSCKVLAVLAMFVFVRSQQDVVAYAAVSALASTGSNVCNIIRARKMVDFRFRGSLRLRRHLKPIIMLFTLTAVTSVYTSMNSTMLGILSSTEEVGYYDVAVKVRSLSVSLVTSLSVVLLPRASYYLGRGERDLFFSLSSKSVRFNFIFSCAVASFILLFSEPIVTLLAGEKYIASVMPMRILSIAVILVAISNVTGTQMMIPLGMERGSLISAVIGAVVAFILNLLLLPSVGALGSAVSTLCAETAVLGTQLVFIRSTGKLSFLSIPILRVCLAILCAAFASGWIQLVSGFGAFIQIILGLALFSSAYLLSLIVMREPLTSSIVKATTSTLVKFVSRLLSS